MIHTLKSCVVHGLQVHAIDIEVDVSRGHPSFCIVGLPDTVIREAIERIRLGIRNSGYTFPFEKRIVINLAPARLRKNGTCFDVAMALGVVIASEKLDYSLDHAMFLGELSLNGDIKPVNGVLPQVIFAQEQGFREIYVPYENYQEACLVSGIEIIPIKTFTEVIEYVRGIKKPQQIKEKVSYISDTVEHSYDMKFIHGQKQAKRALEIAAAGGHHCILIGSPGSGKTMLSQAFPTILPRLLPSELIEVSKVYSISGDALDNIIATRLRPFRSPYHSSTLVSMVGGGKIPLPGEISLAHHGVLFLDEFLEFPISIIDALRQPIEDKYIMINRMSGSFTYPSSFQLIAACNPCPCGYYLDQYRKCHCTQQEVMRYQRKMSGPIIDRIDLFVQVSQKTIGAYKNLSEEESSKNILNRVVQAFNRQKVRYEDEAFSKNSELNLQGVKKYCELSNEAQKFLENAIHKYYLSNRSYLKIIKVSKTIADLDGSDTIEVHHVAETMQYRQHVEFLS